MSPFNSRLRFIHTAVDIPTPDNDCYLNPDLCQKFYVGSILRYNIIIKSKIFISHQRFTRKFQKDSLELRNHVPAYF